MKDLYYFFLSFSIKFHGFLNIDNSIISFLFSYTAFFHPSSTSSNLILHQDQYITLSFTNQYNLHSISSSSKSHHHYLRLHLLIYQYLFIICYYQNYAKPFIMPPLIQFLIGGYLYSSHFVLSS